MNNYVYLLIYTDLDDHLKKVLKELENSDHQLNGHLDAPDKHITEDDILPLLKLDHSVDNVPYYVSINNYLVQLMKTEHILELIEVKINTIPDNKSQFLVTTGVEESETVKELFTNAINTPSAEVNLFVNKFILYSILKHVYLCSTVSFVNFT